MYSEEECSNRYAAVPFEEISGRVRDETDKILNQLEELLHDYRAETDLDRFWHIREYDNVIAVCRSILKDTRCLLYTSGESGIGWDTKVIWIRSGSGGGRRITGQPVPCREHICHFINPLR